MKVKIKSKLGRTFWRFGVQLSPDAWTEFDLTDEELASIRQQCELTVREGGALDIEPNPWPTPAPRAAAAPHPAAPAPHPSASPKDSPRGK